MSYAFHLKRITELLLLYSLLHKLVTNYILNNIIFWIATSLKKKLGQMEEKTTG